MGPAPCPQGRGPLSLAGFSSELSGSPQREGRRVEEGGSSSFRFWSAPPCLLQSQSLTPASCLNHVWHFGRCGIRVSGTQHAKKTLCHVNLCAALCGRGSQASQEISAHFLSCTLSPAWQPMTSDWVTHLSGTHPTHPGSSFQGLVLPSCLSPGAKGKSVERVL